MPQKTATIAISGYEDAAVQALAFGALQQSGWELKYAGEINLIAYTPGKWNKKAEEINVETNDTRLTISSKLIHGESLDITGRNQKNITRFLAALEKVRETATEQQISEWKEILISVKNETIKAAEEEIQKAAEVDKVMNLSQSNLYVTYGIITVNVLVFIAMVVSGISFLTPSGLDILNWGANYLPLTATGDWWRLLSCVFVHIGIIHLLFNMYAFYMVGVYLEPMLGKTRFIIAYLCTGVFASLASLWWHNPPVPSAGASGAIFGMYGVFLALLSTNLIPRHVRKGLLQSIVIFVFYNLAYGIKSGVDNAAHIGGLLSGLVIGYIFYLLIKKEEGDKKNMLIPAAIILTTIIATALYLQNESKKVNSSEKKQIINALKGAKHQDGQKFIDKYDAFIEMQNKALAPLNDTSLTNEQLEAKLREISTPEWEKAQRLVEEIKNYDVSEENKKKIEVMQQYIDLRKEEIATLFRLIKENKEEDVQSLRSTREKIGTVVKQLDSL